uniref:Uncharacterized protein n=1 Tax=candidate division WWE3 bacterium TaxID=2053526 RepID=A0A7C4XTF5_UNCKA
MFSKGSYIINRIIIICFWGILFLLSIFLGFFLIFKFFGFKSWVVYELKFEVTVIFPDSIDTFVVSANDIIPFLEFINENQTIKDIRVITDLQGPGTDVSTIFGIFYKIFRDYYAEKFFKTR